ASKRKDLKGLEAFARPGEGYRLLGKVAYLHTPEGLSSSKLATKIESHLGVPTTARNLRSCRKIAELAASTGH
ncbi:MAG TPA: DUF1697 domain-containing protein, partial [Planctomycetota bacterium]|nr:DUF1697 domain-containing protein [Planctomycetota bacterium]